MDPKITIDRSQAYFWTERWQQGERQADQDLQACRFQDFESLDDFIHSLDDQTEAI
jgi:hypothetical protein